MLQCEGQTPVLLVVPSPPLHPALPRLLHVFQVAAQIWRVGSILKEYLYVLGNVNKRKRCVLESYESANDCTYTNESEGGSGG